MSICHEIVAFRYKGDVSATEQKALQERLNVVVRKYEGFISREYFYSADDNRWIDHVLWIDLAHAKRASEQIMKNPEVGAIFQKMDETSMIFSHYQSVGGTKA